MQCHREPLYKICKLINVSSTAVVKGKKYSRLKRKMLNGKETRYELLDLATSNIVVLFHEVGLH